MISKQDIQKLSELARIEVSDAEAEKLQHDLERVLAYAEQLTRAETGNVEELRSGTGLLNVMRDDAARVSVESDASELLEAAPAREQSFVKVRSVWNR